MGLYPGGRVATTVPDATAPFLIKPVTFTMPSAPLVYCGVAKPGYCTQLFCRVNGVQEARPLA